MRLPRDSSPLLMTILNGNILIFTIIPNNLEQEYSSEMEGGGNCVCEASPALIAFYLGNLELIEVLIANGAKLSIPLILSSQLMCSCF